MARFTGIAVLIAALTFAHGTHAETPAVLHYTITPVLLDGTLRAVDVTLTTRAGEDGTLDLRIDGPAHAARASVAMAADTPGRLKLTSTPRSALTLSYRVDGNVDFSAARTPGPFMGRDWLHAPCPTLLALPTDGVPRVIDLHWQLPAGWKALTTLPANAPAGPDVVANAGCLMGRHIVETDTPISGGATLRMFTTDAAASAGLARTVAATLRPFAVAAGTGAVDFPMYVASVDSAGEGFSAWSNGPFMSVVKQSGDPGEALAEPLTANYRALVRTASPATAPATAWFASGMQTFLALAPLATQRGVESRGVAAYLDQVLVDYGNSPLRRASQAELVAEWTRLPQAREVAPQRGLLFAWLLDARLRAVTDGKTGMADVLRHLDPASTDPAPALAAAVRASGGGDITPLIDKYIVRGELLQLPTGALGRCMKVRTDTGMYDWQVQRVEATCPR